jgi:hypothetical protein
LVHVTSCLPTGSCFLLALVRRKAGVEERGKGKRGKERKGKERKGKERKGRERRGISYLPSSNNLLIQSSFPRIHAISICGNKIYFFGPRVLSRYSEIEIRLLPEI